MALRLVFVTLALGLSACAKSGYQIGQMTPQILGGAPDTIPPPLGTPEYDEWLKKPGPVPERVPQTSK